MNENYLNNNIKNVRGENNLKKGFAEQINSGSTNNIALTNYTKTTKKPTYDEDSIKIIEIVRILNNLFPRNLPTYNFDISEINGEYYYLPSGKFLLIRDFDTDIIRDYYPSKDNPNIVGRILEHNKKTGILKTKIEPIYVNGELSKVNVTIFDQKINKKYTIIQTLPDGTVSNMSEFLQDGKSFKTLFRNTNNYKPVRYIEGKINQELGFVITDCLLDSNGAIARIKTYSKKKEVNIEYTDDKKNITVKSDLK